jgi:hypothetical protein
VGLNAKAPAAPVHHEGLQPEDKIWTMNVSTTVDNCNWWNNYGDIAVGAPSAPSEKLTFESACMSSFWGGTDIVDSWDTKNDQCVQG